MSRRLIVFAIGLLLRSASAATCASAYEPSPSPWLGEFVEHPPGLPPPPPVAPTEAAAGEIAPDTRIDRVAFPSGGRSVKLSFVSTQEVSAFSCRFDSREAFACTSPLVLRRLRPGPPRLSVSTIDPAGEVDPAPTTYHFPVRAR
jgi:hypothetical protein